MKIVFTIFVLRLVLVAMSCIPKQALRNIILLKATLLVLILLAASASDLFGQIDSRPTHGITLGYFNDKFGSHGMRLGYEVPLLEGFRNNTDAVSIKHALVAKMNFGFYNHKRHHIGLLANVTFGYRYTSSWGLIVEPLHVGGGYLHSFLGGKTYKMDENGNFNQVKSAGNATSILPYIQLLGLGYDFRQSSNIPLSFFVSIDPYVQRSVNTQPRLKLATPISLTYFYR